MNASEIRRLKKERDAARAAAERFDRQGEGKSQMVQEHLKAKAATHRADVARLNAALGRHA